MRHEKPLKMLWESISTSSIVNVCLKSQSKTTTRCSVCTCGWNSLLKLQLPTYCGEPSKLSKNWYAFEAAVHNQGHVQKCSYLLSTLKGSVCKAIEGLAIPNANYLSAVYILKQRFGDINVIKQLDGSTG